MDELEFIDGVFNSLDSNSDEAVELLNVASKNISQSILSEVNDTIASLKKDSAGNVIASVENIKKVNLLSTKLDTFFTSPEYQKSVASFLQTYSSNVGLINSYFTQIAGNFNASDSLYKQLASASQASTVDSLIGAGVSANVKDPIIKVLTNSITTGTNRSEVYALLKTEILGDIENLGRLQRYVKQIGNDAITQFNSNYIQIISTDLGLDHYYYRGTTVVDSREFCDKYHGKFFKQEDLINIIAIESASNKGKGWHGMIKGTNWPNFKVYRGGWNCRHYLIPISKEVYESKQDRQYGMAA